MTTLQLLNSSRVIRIEALAFGITEKIHYETDEYSLSPYYLCIKY